MYKTNISRTMLLAAALVGALSIFQAPAATAQTTTGSSSFSSLFAFPALNSSGDGLDGVAPASGLVVGPLGNLYGTTPGGGLNGTGTVYVISPLGVLTTLYSFSDYSSGTNSDGANPTGALAFGADGNLYGTTTYGGANGAGTVFEITPIGLLTPLHSFSPNTDGANPSAGLTLGGDGNLYGTTPNNGANGYGTIFRITPAGVLTTLYAFGFTDGASPLGGLALGSDGNFYGTTEYGGATYYGTVFQITPAGALTTLYSFSDDSAGGNDDGALPCAGLVQGGDGNFYGATQYGGGNDTGTIFKITPAGALTTLYEFDDDYSGSTFGNSDGAFPKASLLAGSDGNFYGTTEFGGASDSGTVYAITPLGALTTLYSFSKDLTAGGNSDGAHPTASLAASGGVLYGTTNAGGANDNGTVFDLPENDAPTSITTSSPLPALDSTRFDFNKDGHADLLWYNTGTGGVSVWDMNDESVLNYGGTFAQVSPQTNWVPVAAPDVNGDGYPDLLWWNSKTGEMCFWTLQNTTVTNYGNDFATVADTDWKPVAAADVIGSTWELIFQNKATGAISAWLMLGELPVTYGGTLASLGVNSPWQIVGAPDIDGDGLSDLLFWNSQTGEVSWWSMNLPALQMLASHVDCARVTDTNWHLVGSEDTNGDGHPDLVWWNSSSGVVSRWLMSGSAVTGYADASPRCNDTTWQPTGIR